MKKTFWKFNSYNDYGEVKKLGLVSSDIEFFPFKKVITFIKDLGISIKDLNPHPSAIEDVVEISEEDFEYLKQYSDHNLKELN